MRGGVENTVVLVGCVGGEGVASKVGPEHGHGPCTCTSLIIASKQGYTLSVLLLCRERAQDTPKADGMCVCRGRGRTITHQPARCPLSHTASQHMPHTWKGRSHAWNLMNWMLFITSFIRPTRLSVYSISERRSWMRYADTLAAHSTTDAHSRATQSMVGIQEGPSEPHASGTCHFSQVNER
jgi:hypothetical protein